MRTLEFRVVDEAFVIALHFQYRIGLPLGTAQLGSMLLETSSPWKQQVKKGLWVAIDQSTQTIIPGLFHVTFPLNTYSFSTSPHISILSQITDSLSVSRFRCTEQVAHSIPERLLYVYTQIYPYQAKGVKQGSENS